MKGIVRETRTNGTKDDNWYKGATMRDHTKLRAFELADEVVTIVYEFTAGFPKEEQAGLTAQIRRAAVTVPSKIVEGCTCDVQEDFLRFLYVAYGSLRALRYQLDLSRRLGLMPSHNGSEPEEKIVETEKVLYGLIRSIKKSSKKDN